MKRFEIYAEQEPNKLKIIKVTPTNWKENHQLNMDFCYLIMKLIKLEETILSF